MTAVLGSPPLYVLALSGLATLTYLLAPAWFLREERRAVVVTLLALTAAALALRLYNFPPHHVDEGLTLECTRGAYERGELFGDNCNGMPSLITILFELPLVHWFGPDVIAMRTYSLLGTCLAVPVVFSIVRTMGGSIAAGLFAAAAMATVPWAIFYARLYQGGELVINQLLLLAVLARAIWRRATLVDVWIGSVALCLAFYTYWSSRSMVAMPLVAVLLATGWKNRTACLLVLVLGVAGALPFLLGDAQYRWTGLSMSLMSGEAVAGDYWAVLRRGVDAIRTMYESVGDDGWLSTVTGGLQPAALLVLAMIGPLTGVRRFLFLGAVFAAGLTPGFTGYGVGASTHRLICAYAIIPVAAGLGLDVLQKWRWPHRLAALGAAGWVVAASLRVYFGEPYQVDMNRWYDAARTAVVRSFPADKPVFTNDLWGFADARRLDLGTDRVRILTAEGWLKDDAFFAFGDLNRSLLPFYQELVGAAHIRQYGDCFTVYVPPGTWQGSHGWRYTSRCGENVQTAVIPTLYHERIYLEQEQERCPDESAPVRTWDARWVGAETRAWFVSGEGTFEVQVDGVAKTLPNAQEVEFALRPGATMHVGLVHSGHLVVSMLVAERGLAPSTNPAARRLAYWSETEPLTAPSSIAGR